VSELGALRARSFNHTLMSRTAVGRVLVLIGLCTITWWALEMASTRAFQREQTVSFSRAVPRASTAPGRTLPSASAIVVPPHGPVGRLEIPRLHLAIMVLEGDDERTLGKAAGHLPDTVMPWEHGNAAIAGHRDTLFRPLKDIKRGDEIRLTTPAGLLTYLVTELKITTPDDVDVLAPTTNQVLTLVTCYPFYYIGSAPKRMIVRAERVAG
jgi:sortase A